MHKKQHLPEKMCEVCQRPFSWRKKWAKNWEEVKYCSQACREGKTKRPESIQPFEKVYVLRYAVMMRSLMRADLPDKPRR